MPPGLEQRRKGTQREGNRHSPAGRRRSPVKRAQAAEWRAGATGPLGQGVQGWPAGVTGGRCRQWQHGGTHARKSVISEEENFFLLFSSFSQIRLLSAMVFRGFPHGFSCIVERIVFIELIWISIASRGASAAIRKRDWSADNA